MFMSAHSLLEPCASDPETELMSSRTAKVSPVQGARDSLFLPIAWLALRRTVYRRRFTYGLGLGWALAILVNTIFVLIFLR
jgi:hypothetical protein